MVKYKSHGEVGAPEAKKGKKGKKGKKASNATGRTATKLPCHGSDCHKTANVYLKDGTSTGYCFACAAQYAPVSLSEKRSANECSVDGCSNGYKVTVGDKRYCNKCNPDEESKRRRKAEQTLYEAKRYQEKKAKLST